VSAFANRSAHMFKEAGVKRGEAIGIMLSNGGGAELPAFFLGAGNLGAVSALLPPLLRGDALVHSIVIAKVEYVVYSQDLAEGDT
jgi:acyl-CoA synthetase (AMP-forming)/AMP-acid ligase II